MNADGDQLSWLPRLHAAGLTRDTTQLLDALWLSAHLPAPAEVDVGTDHVDISVAASSHRASLEDALPQASTAPRQNLPPMADVVIGNAAAAAPMGQAVYADVAGDAGDTVLRARAIRVAGATALRDAAGMACALRPLGKRRRSAVRFHLDETATAERFADTGSLVPVLVAERERFFTATLLVEDTPALPLWRSLANELETLLARQGGFRHFRRLELTSVASVLRIRSRSGALHAPQILRDDDSSLLLLATDGTTDAWSDGRMAAMLADLGRRTSLAVLQWMPEQLWPHTALGSAELTVSAARAGVPNSELRVTRPRWLGVDEAVVAVPLAALTPAALARLAGVLMGKPGARTGACVLWRHAADPPQQVDAEDAAAEALSPTQRIANFRSVASARVLQAAVQLSAAAPLTLPVVRLVHRVMQPDAPAEDLPLLLLGGLLERRARAAGSRHQPPSDNDVEFEFAPGVRASLQASLLKHEAAEVRRAVSTYIAERSGSPLDFSALLLDPQGALSLPEWARPFAEVTRQVEALFRTEPDLAPASQTVREPEWSPGVTVQASARLPGQVTKLRWSPDGQQLAVLHEHGLTLLRLEDTGPGQRRLVHQPLAMREPAQVLFVKGFGMDDAACEALIAAARHRLSEGFRGEWRAHFHTVGEIYRRNPERAPGPEISKMLRLAERPRALVCFIGGPAFFESNWVRHAHTQVLRRFDLSLPPPVLDLRASTDVASAAQRVDWQIGRRGTDSVLLSARGTAASAGSALADLLYGLGASAVPEVAFGSNACSMAWNNDGDLLVADAARRLVVRERDLHQYQAFPKDMDSSARPDIEAHPKQRAMVFLTRSDLRVARPDALPIREHLGEGGGPAPAAAWAADGSRLAVRDTFGRLRLFAFDGGHWAAQSDDDARRAAAGPSAAHRRSAFAVATSDAAVMVVDASQSWNIRALSQTETLAWSHDDLLLACGAAGGKIRLMAGEAADGLVTLDTAVPEPQEGRLTMLQFVPRCLDTGFEALSVAHGDELFLLRIDAKRLTRQLSVAAAAPTLDADAALEACCEVLHGLTLAFQRLWPNAELPSQDHNAATKPGTNASRTEAMRRLAHALSILSTHKFASLFSRLAIAVSRLRVMSQAHGKKFVPSDFSIDGDLADLVAQWSACADATLGAADAPAQVIVDVPLPTRAVVHVAAFASSRQFELAMQETGEGRATLAMDGKAYLFLVRTLGAALVTATALRSGRPMPAAWAVPGLTVLWVDDIPGNNIRAVETLAERGVRVLIARTTNQALELLKVEPVVVVISDMGRPPDTRAGYTLLEAMRGRGFMQPFMIYSRATAPEHHDEARRAGAVGTTDRFLVLERWLRDALLASYGAPGSQMA